MLFTCELSFKQEIVLMFALKFISTFIVKTAKE